MSIQHEKTSSSASRFWCIQMKSVQLRRSVASTVTDAPKTVNHAKTNTTCLSKLLHRGNIGTSLVPRNQKGPAMAPAYRHHRVQGNSLVPKYQLWHLHTGTRVPTWYQQLWHLHTNTIGTVQVPKYLYFIPGPVPVHRSMTFLWPERVGPDIPATFIIQLPKSL